MSSELMKIHDAIASRLVFLAGMLRLNNSFNLSSLNIHSENFFKELLNALLKCELSNYNLGEHNNTAIDLGDEVGKIAFQITSTGKKSKVDRTLKLFISKNYNEKFDKLIVLVIKEKYNPQKNKDFIHEDFCFSYSHDVWDLGDLIEKINKENIENIKQIKSLICKHIPFPDGQDSQLPRYDQLINEFVYEYSSLSKKSFFEGRGNEICKLNNWYRHSNDNYAILADAGVGKSALLVNWYLSLDSNENIIFIPISNRYQLNSQIAFYEILARCLEQIANKSIVSCSNPSFLHYKNECFRLLRDLQRADKNVLIIIDGVDEAEWNILKGLEFIEPFVQIICSFRDVIKVPESKIKNILGVNDNSILHLSKLTSDGVKAILSNIDDFSKMNKDYLATELFRITEGEPLLLNLILDQIIQLEENKIYENLSTLPVGYSAYFDDVLTDENASKTEGILAILSIAKEPMCLSDIQAIYRIANHNSEILSEGNSFGEIKRIVSKINNRYTLTHPKLAYYLKEEYFDDTTYITEYRNFFIEWGMSYIDNTEVPEYLLKQFSRHVLEDNNLEVGINFLQNSWREAHLKTPHRYCYYLNDLLNFRELLKNKLLNSSITREQYIEYFIEVSLYISSINGRGKSMGLESALLAYKNNCISYDYLKSLINRSDRIDERLRFCILTNEDPSSYYDYINGDPNEFNYWILLIEHPSLNISEFSSEKAKEMLDNIKIDNKIYESDMHVNKKLTKEQYRKYVMVERITAYCSAKPNVALAKKALEYIDYIVDPINKGSIKLKLGKVIGVDLVNEVLDELGQENVYRIRPLIDLLAPISKRVNKIFFEKLLADCYQLIGTCSYMQIGSILECIIILCSILSTGEDEYWSQMIALLNYKDFQYYLCSGLVKGLDYAHIDNKNRFIELIFVELSKLRTGNQQVGLYVRFAEHLSEDLKERSIRLALEAGEKNDDYRSYYEFKCMAVLNYGKEEELRDLLKEINQFYDSYDRLTFFNHLFSLSKSKYKVVNCDCIKLMIDELDIRFEEDFLDSRYFQLLTIAKENDYMYHEISYKAYHYYVDFLSKGKVACINPTKLHKDFSNKLNLKCYNALLNNKKHDYIWLNSALYFLDYAEDMQKIALISLIDEAIELEENKQQVYSIMLRMYNSTKENKYKNMLIESFSIMSKKEVMHYYRSLYQNVVDDPLNILDDLLNEKEVLENIQNRIIMYSYMKWTDDEILLDLSNGLINKDEEFVINWITFISKNNLFNESQDLVYSLARSHDLLHFLDIEVLKKVDNNHLKNWSEIIEKLSTYNRAYLLSHLPLLMDLVHIDSELLLGKVNQAWKIWK